MGTLLPPRAAGTCSFQAPQLSRFITLWGGGRCSSNPQVGGMRAGTETTPPVRIRLQAQALVLVNGGDVPRPWPHSEGHGQARLRV